MGAERDVREVIRASAELTVFRRGMGLARTYRAGDLVVEGDAASGRMVGRDGAYRTRVTITGGAVSGECECVARLSMPVCKHMVALALEAFDAPAGPGVSVGELVAGLPPATLVRLVTDLATRDAGVRARVEALAASQAGTVDAKALRSVITKATTPPGQPGWRAARPAAERAMGAVDLLLGLVDAGAAEAPGLVEHMILRVDRLLSRVDDSGGHLGALHDEVRNLHLQACRAVPPRPKDLADSLLRLAARTDWDWVHDGPERYSDLLGTDGLARLGDRIDRAIAADPPPADEPWRLPSHHQFTLGAMAESAARASGDVDHLVAVLARDLSHPRRYVMVATALDDAGRQREALTWLERAHAAFGGADDRLRRALTGAYVRDGATDDALSLVRQHLTGRPTAAAFRELRGVCPVEQWPAERAEALRHIATASIDQHVLALLADESVDEALRVGADDGLRAETRLALARAAAKEHIGLSLQHYRTLIDLALQDSGRSAYRRGIDVLREMRQAADAHHRGDQVVAHAAALRHEHRRRPLFTDLLDDLRWWSPPTER